MNGDQYQQIDLFESVHSFVVAGASDDLTDRQWSDFERLLQESDHARHLYAKYVSTLVHLPSVLASMSDSELPLPTSVDSNAEGTEPSPATPFGFLFTTLPSTLGYVSSGWLVSYLVATVVVGIGLWIASVTPAFYPPQIARQSSVPSRAVAELTTELVGRITGLVDCEWSDASTEAFGGERVPLGHKYALASGLMEITYDTGAKVILQGPITYEVESKNGGFMSVGKLTGRVTTQAARGLTIRTPTATVTDLGTEFGVEVSKEGHTTSHVFRGVVEVQPAANDGRQEQPIRLLANESVQVKKRSGNKATVHRGMADAAAFVCVEQFRGLVQASRERSKHTARRALPIYDKTLVAWVSLDNVQQRGVGILSLVNIPVPQFDGIVFGELAPAKWMSGSGYWDRTEKNQSAYPTETARPGELVQIAIVYDCTTITIYRNGRQYAKYDTANRLVFERDSILLIGKRHLTDGTNTIPTLAGIVEEARLYDVALPPPMIVALKPNEASPIRPLGWWTFEDGTARDLTGHFPMGELHGNAKIANGKLILDGKDSYLLVPSALPREQQTPTDAEGHGANPTENRRRNPRL